MLLFVVGLIVLRLFPPVMRALARVVSPWRSLTLLLGAWYLGRTPTHYARTVLLLTMAGALAVFAVSFRTTLDTSYDDRALHAVGAAVRMSEPYSTTVPFEQIEQESGGSVARVKRVVGAFDRDERSGRIEIGALDAKVVSQQLADRNADWALPPSQLASIVSPPGDASRAVIEDFGGALRLRVSVRSLQQETPIGVKMLDANGRYWWYALSVLEVPTTDAEPEVVTGSTRLTAEADFYLPLEGARSVQGQSRFRPGVVERAVAPLTLISIDLALTRAGGEILLHDLIYERSGETQLLADFSSGAWEATPLEVGEEPLDFLQVDGRWRPLSLECHSVFTAWHPLRSRPCAAARAALGRGNEAGTPERRRDGEDSGRTDPGQVPRHGSV